MRHHLPVRQMAGGLVREAMQPGDAGRELLGQPVGQLRRPGRRDPPELGHEPFHLNANARLPPLTTGVTV